MKYCVIFPMAGREGKEKYQHRLDGKGECAGQDANRGQKDTPKAWVPPRHGNESN